jgi:hypothetical protein
MKFRTGSRKTASFYMKIPGGSSAIQPIFETIFEKNNPGFESDMNDSPCSLADSK